MGRRLWRPIPANHKPSSPSVARRGHAEDPENIRCDQLAAQARKGVLLEDVGYES